jgi:hypothetical protein
MANPKIVDVADAVRAVLDDRGGFDGWWAGVDEKTQEEILEAIGRAAIEAMREPTDDMLEYGYACLIDTREPQDQPWDQWDAMIKRRYNALISAALR